MFSTASASAFATAAETASWCPSGWFALATRMATAEVAAPRIWFDTALIMTAWPSSSAPDPWIASTIRRDRATALGPSNGLDPANSAAHVCPVRAV